MPTRAVLNVTVTKNGQTVPALVRVTARNLTGLTREILMQQTSVNNYVSYMGSYQFVHGEVIDFLIEGQPHGSNKQLTLNYRERMWAEGDLPEPAVR